MGLNNFQIVMTFITNNVVFDIIAILATLIIGIIAYIKWHLSYWEKHGVPSLNPGVIFGDAEDFFLGKCTLGEQFRIFYKKFKSKGLKHGGIFMCPKPFYIPTDPEIIKHIMNKDFQYFTSRGNYMNEEHDPLSGHLLNLEDVKWKNMRVKLTPTFTSGKMKMMFQTLADCATDLKNIMNESAVKQIPVDIKDILGRFTTDIIASVAFGLECNSLKNPEAEFRKYGKKVFEIGFFDKIKTICLFTMPHSILSLCRFKFTKPDVEAFFFKAIRDTVDYRETNNIYRKDFMHLLLQLKNRGSITDDDKIIGDEAKEKALTMNELAAQSFVFFLAGFETSSTTMTWALYELAVNPEIQEKLRNEIIQVLKKHDKLTYEEIMEMTYMDQVIYETLRKYPPIPLLTRRCNTNYNIPNTSGKLSKGVSVGIPVLALHTDPEYYPNPEKFDPDRFNQDNVKSRLGCTWIPFGEGPRLCIGLRFGMLQSKVGLTELLKNYKVKLSSKTKLPVKLNTRAFITSATGGIWLDVETLN